jgi:hypothetical protein
MALTPEEKKWVLKALEEADRNLIEKILASLRAFSDWLRITSIKIFNKVKDNLQNLWKSICNFFS